MSGGSSEHFVDKWLQAEPWHRLLLVFESPERRHARRLLESLAYEFRNTALDGSDARVIAAKLGWWTEEWRLLAAGAPRHPITQALASVTSIPIDAHVGGAWVTAAAALSDDTSDTDAVARISRWQRYAQAQADATAAWLPSEAGDAYAHAVSLLSERIAHAQADIASGRLPVPLDAMAHLSLTRAQFADGDPATHQAYAHYARDLVDALGGPSVRAAGGYRRGQSALVRLRSRALVRATARATDRSSMSPPLPALRAAWAVWCASRWP